MLEKSRDWVISSQGSGKPDQGSTTTGNSLKWPVAGKPFIPLDHEELRRLYEVEKLTGRQIAAQLGVGHRTVSRRLQAIGVNVRAPGPERHAPLRDADWLRTQYIVNRKGLQEIADEIGASTAVVRTWMDAHGIERRPRNQHTGRNWSEDVRQRMSSAKKGRLTGESNPNWRGGLVHPDKRLRASYASKAWSAAVRQRDGHKCVECGATGKLHAHHIKPWKDNEALRFDVQNGATLCPPCHQKAHGWLFPAWAYHGETRTSAKHSQE